mgnify:FL=1
MDSINPSLFTYLFYKMKFILLRGDIVIDNKYIQNHNINNITQLKVVLDKYDMKFNEDRYMILLNFLKNYSSIKKRDIKLEELQDIVIQLGGEIGK